MRKISLKNLFQMEHVMGRDSQRETQRAIIQRRRHQCRSVGCCANCVSWFCEIFILQLFLFSFNIFIHGTWLIFFLRIQFHYFHLMRRGSAAGWVYTLALIRWLHACELTGANSEAFVFAAHFFPGFFSIQFILHILLLSQMCHTPAMIVEI